MKEYIWIDQVKTRSREPILWVRTAAGELTQFTGKPVAGVVGIVATHSFKGGKWSGTEYTLASPDDAIVVEQCCPFDGYGETWADLAKGFRPLVAETDREDFARKVADIWLKTDGAFFRAISAARENEAAMATLETKPATTYFGFAISDSMFPPMCSVRRSPITDEAAARQIPLSVPILNPSHAATIAALSTRLGISVEIPDKPPVVSLKSGDTLIVFSVRGLPRLTDRHEYTSDEIAGAVFVFGAWMVE